jgi:pimeloyl-ACP methyl ester carboxylesterase
MGGWIGFGMPLMRVPTLLYAGTADRRYELIVRAQREIPGSELLSLPGLGHLETMARADLVLPPLAFLERSEPPRGIESIAGGR